MKRISQHPLFILLTASAFAGLLLTNVLAQGAPDIKAPVSPTFSALEIGGSWVSDEGILFSISSDPVATFGVRAVIGAGSLAQSRGAYGMSQNNIGIVSEVATTAARGEGDAYGVYATGEIAGIVASSSSVGTRVSGAVEATGDTLGILGYGAQSGVKVSDATGRVSALGYEKNSANYGLYTDGKIVLDGSLVSSGTVNVSNNIILPSMDVYGATDINSLSIGAWKSSQTDVISWEADSVNFALDVSNPYYFIIGNADSETFPLSIDGDFTVGQAGISSVSEFELSPGLEVKKSLHSEGKITANEIGSFYTVQNGPSATATAQCSVGELVGCTGVVYEGEGALKQAGSPQSGQCTVSSTDSSTKVLAYAYCFDPEGAGTSGTLTALPNSDSDSWPDFQDNCPNVANEDQVDSDNDGEGDACHGTSCPDFSSPPTVTKDNTNQRFSISWDDIWGNNPYYYNYEIYYDNTKKAYDSITSTSLTLPYYQGYSDSKSYTFKVRTFEEMNSEPVCYGNWSSVAFQHCPPPYTPSPTAGISGNTISVSWSAVPGADSYCYYIFGDSEDATSTQETCNTGGTSQIYNTNEFESGYTYTFNVRAKNTSCSSNQYSGWGSTDFSLDVNTPPTGTININSGATYTTSTSVTLTLSCSDSDGCSKMRFSANNSSWSSEENYSTSKSYTLSSGDGTKYVYVQFKDNAGNWSTQSISDSITLDTTSPNAPTVSGTSPTSDTTPTWSWTSGGGGNGNYRYKLDNSDLSSGTTSTTSTSYIPSSALSVTSHTLYVQERDAAGNWSVSGSKAITIESPCSAPGTPNPTYTFSYSLGAFQFDWASVSGASYYIYYITKNGDSTSLKIGSTTSSDVTITESDYQFTFNSSNDYYTFYVAAVSCTTGSYGNVSFKHPIVVGPQCVNAERCGWVTEPLIDVIPGATADPWHWWVNREDMPCTFNCSGVRATDCWPGGGFCSDNISSTTSLVDVLNHTDSLLNGWDGTDENGDVTGDMTFIVGAYLVTEGIITGTDVGNISDASIANAINGILDTLGYFETQAGNTYTSDFNTQATITGKTLIQTGGY